MFKQTPITGELWRSKETGFQVNISHISNNLTWYTMKGWNGPIPILTELFLEKMEVINHTKST